MEASTGPRGQDFQRYLMVTIWLSTHLWLSCSPLALGHQGWAEIPGRGIPGPFAVDPSRNLTGDPRFTSNKIHLRVSPRDQLRAVAGSKNPLVQVQEILQLPNAASPTSDFILQTMADIHLHYISGIMGANKVCDPQPTLLIVAILMLAVSANP